MVTTEDIKAAAKRRKLALQKMIDEMTVEQAKEIWHDYNRFSLRHSRATFVSFVSEEDKYHRPTRAMAFKLKEKVLSLITKGA